MPTIDDVPGRDWYKVDRDTFAFLVDRPLTFGHSQLCVPSQVYEEGSFGVAADHIGKCIRILRVSLGSLNLSDWSALARYTRTEGTYQKTLVLKASASETKDQYRVHLVPYFCSHLLATNELYRALQGLKPPESGGLLCWLGEREKIVDYDMRNGPDDEAAKQRVSSFKLVQLASVLRNTT